MKKYLFIDTWNGQGYSDSKASIIETDNPQWFLKNELNTQANPDTDDWTIIKNGELDFSYVDSEEEDAGRVRLIELEKGLVGVVIEPNINEAYIYTDQEEWDNFIELVEETSSEYQESHEIFGECHHDVGDNGDMTCILFNRESLGAVEPKKLWEEYDFNTKEELYNYVHGSIVNGQRQQAKELYYSIARIGLGRDFKNYIKLVFTDAQVIEILETVCPE